MTNISLGGADAGLFTHSYTEIALVYIENGFFKKRISEQTVSVCACVMDYSYSGNQR